MATERLEAYKGIVFTFIQVIAMLSAIVGFGTGQISTAEFWLVVLLVIIAAK